VNNFDQFPLKLTASTTNLFEASRNNDQTLNPCSSTILGDVKNEFGWDNNHRQFNWLRDRADAWVGWEIEDEFSAWMNRNHTASKAVFDDILEDLVSQAG
jgi:hypothetical protein